MAELSSQDVVNQVQSTGAPASVDVSAATTYTPAASAADSQAHTSDDSAPSASAFDRGTGGTVQDADNTQASSGGQLQDTDNLSTQVIQKQTETGTKDGSHHGDSEDGRRSAAGSVSQSIGSEADLNVNDGSDIASKIGDNIARNLAKKPSSFKAVSVTKNFLAKAGTPASQLAKATPETTIPSSLASSTFATNAARPRLVAKTGSAQKLTMSAQLGNGKKSGQANSPDPMQVWNRNRVQTPTATPKHLTNEELREQYGIQLASIPLGDGDDKGNKWADLDEDEDDNWAPEVIEWSDGSKVNLAEAEKKAAAEKEKAAEEAKKREEATRQASLATRTPLSLGARGTVLKVGAAAQSRAGQDSGPFAAKPSDKPTLVAKPVATAPVKSPWATLPPVEKVSPLPMNAPAPAVQQGPPPRMHHSENHFVDRERGPPLWRHAKEMEADDFSRIPRESPNSVPRELFNSHSGKYEPVSGDARRGSIKREQNFRPPSVLQRPGPEQEGQAPAKPDVDPQAVATADQEAAEHPSFGRQQGDVRSAAEANQLWRRQPGAWMPSHMRNGSQNSPPSDHAVLAAVPDESVDTAPSAQPPAATDQPQQPQQPQEDPVAVQKKLMREKREAAIKRRQEEEAKEEAERKERIRKKLEAMGPPPDKKEKEKEKSAVPQATTTSPAVSAVTPAATANEEAGSGVASKEDITRSPPKPPVPAPAGPPQQYGMIKVHPTPLPNGTAASSSTAAPLHSISASRFADSQRAAPKLSPSSQQNMNVSPFEQTAAKHASGEGTRVESQHEKSRWNNNTGQASKGWERPSDVPNMVPNTNLWASGSHRTIGNGDFNTLGSQNRGRFRQQQQQQPQQQQQQQQQQRQISPESILPSPQSVAPARLFHEDKSLTPAPVGSHLSGPPAPVQKPELNFGAEFSGVGSASQPPAPSTGNHGLPSPLAHPASVQAKMPPSRPFAGLSEHKNGIDAWTNFAANVGDHDAVSRARISQDRNRQFTETPNQTQTQGYQQEQRRYNETWKQVTRGQDAGQRQLVSTHAIARGQGHGEGQASLIDDVVRPSPVSMPPQHPRASRFHDFFGHQTPAAPPHIQAQIRRNIPERPSSPLAPPPEDLSHPVRDSVGHRPRVRLPGQKYEEAPAKPVVRLPPPKPMAQYPVLAELRGMPPPLRGPAQPLAKTLNWQHRFNGLFNKNAEKRAMESTEFSSSKAQFDILSSDDYASVNFPQPGQISPVSPSFASKTSGCTIEEEDALFDEELHPGSTPPVRVPANKYASNWRPAPTPVYTRTALGDPDVFSRFVWLVGLEDFQGRKVVVSVRLPTMSISKKLELTSSNIHNPRMAGKNSTFQKSGAPFQKLKPFSKGTRKPGDAPTRFQRATSTREGMQGSSSTRQTPAPAPVVAAAPTTWAKRVSAGI